MPDAVVTLTGPVVAPAGTRIVSVLEVAWSTAAWMPLTRTMLLAGAPGSNSPPVTVTTMPASALAGAKPVTTGAPPITVTGTVTVPYGVRIVRVQEPSVAVGSTVICRTKVSTSVCWPVTWIPHVVVTSAPEKLKPVRVTEVVWLRGKVEVETPETTVVCGTPDSRVMLRMLPTAS